MSILRNKFGRIRVPFRIIIFMALSSGLLITGVLFYLSAVLTGFIEDPHGIEGISSPAAAMLFDIPGFFYLLAVSAIMVIFIDGRPFASLGLWFYRGWGSEFGLGCLVGFGLMAIIFVAYLVPGYAVAGYGEPDIWGLIVYPVLLLFVALFEETALRGYLLQALTEGAGKSAAVIITSLLFALMHAGNPNVSHLSVIETFLAGIMLGAAYVKTGALWLPVGIHFAWNLSMSVIFGFPVSGLNLPVKLIRTEIEGPVLITGGRYGPEGGLIGMIVTLVFIAVICFSRWIGPSPVMGKLFKRYVDLNRSAESEEESPAEEEEDVRR